MGNPECQQTLALTSILQVNSVEFLDAAVKNVCDLGYPVNEVETSINVVFRRFVGRVSNYFTRIM